MIDSSPFRLSVCIYVALTGRKLFPLVLLILVGCSVQDAAPKTSLFEDDHAVPLHWPTDVADISVKLRERLSAPEANAQLLAEIEDLVAWTAEVAADTNLPEADWLPLYQATESMTANLRSAKGVMTPQNKTQLEALCKLIDEAARKIPERPAHLVKDES